MAKENAKSNKGLLIGIISGVVLVAALIFLCTFKAQRWESVTYELGTGLESELKYYLKGTKIAMRNGVLDISGVDNMTVGEYTATVSFKRKAYTYTITIEDTTAPEIVLNNNHGDINIGLDYDFDTIVTAATDLAGDVKTWMTVDGVKHDKLHFDKIADYKIVVYAEDINDNLATEEFIIHAVDTIAPEIKGFSEYAYYGVSDRYEIYDFIEEITDNSGSFEAQVLMDGTDRDGLVIFTEPGEYHITVIAKDDAGNTSNYKVSVLADYRPELYGVSDKTIKKNTEFNLLEGIFAWDNEEGFISERVSLSGDVDTSTEGVYQVEYMVVDQNGLSQKETAEITVSAKTYDTNTAVYSDEFITKLFVADAFNYELLEEADWDKAAEMMYPCQIALMRTNSRGSGFIYKIDEDYIYIGTMGHCVSANSKGSTIDICFYNPTYDSKMARSSTKRTIEGLKIVDCIRVYGDEDKAMFIVSRDQIPNDVLIYLKEVNKTNENNVSLTNGIYTDTMYVAKDMYKAQFKKSFTVFNKTGADYEYLLNYYPKYKNSEVWLLTNEGGVSGQSGSLLYDGYGNPVASLSGRMYYGDAVIGRHVLFNRFPEMYEKLRANLAETE